MKSKMKTTFAIIAVALMIMVAAVPMIGAFTSDSSAITVVDPKIDGTITITGVVVDKDNAPVTPGTNNVLVSYGNNNAYKIVASWGQAGTYTATLQETSITGTVTITYVDKDGKAIDNYDSVKLSGLTIGSYTANIKETDTKPGMTKATLTLMMAGDNANNLGYYGKVSGKYFVYESATATTAIDTGTFKEDGTADIYYKDASKVFVKLENVKIVGAQDSAVTFAASSAAVQCTINTTYGTTTIAAKEYAIPVTLTTGNSSATLLVTDLKFTPTGASAITLKYITRGINTTTTTAYFTMQSAGNTEGTYAATVGYSTSTTQAATAAWDSTDANVVVTPSVIIGSVQMGSAVGQIAKQSGKLTLSYTSGTSTSTKEIDVNADGTFAALAITGITQYTATKFGSIEVAEGAEITANTSAEVKLNQSGFSLVKGLVYYSTTDYFVANKALKVAGTVTTFGTAATNDAGVFVFYATTGARFTLTGNDASTTIVYSKDTNVVAGTASNDLKIEMSTKDIKVLTQDALGNKITATGIVMKDSTDNPLDLLEKDFKSGYVTAKIRSDVDPKAYKVTIADTTDGFTFTADTYDYEKVFKSNEANYKISFYEIGAETPLLTGVAPTAYISYVYKNSTGSLVYDSTGENLLVNGPTAGVWTVKLNASDVAVKEIKSEVQKAVVIYGADACTAAIFKKAYLMTPDSKGEFKVISQKDSLSGKLTRFDGKTAIAGATVTLMLDNGEEADTVVDTVVTDNKGEFTVYSNAKLKASNYFVFERTGYTFANEVPLQADGKVYSATKDLYVATLKDTDGSVVVGEDNSTLTIGGTPFTYDYVLGAFVGKAAYAAGDKVNITAANLQGRTINAHTFTAEEISTGLLSLTTNESAYEFQLVDASGAPLKISEVKISEDTGFKVFKSTGTEFDDGVAATVYTDDTGYVGSVVLKDLEAPYVAYYISADQPAAANKYAFSPLYMVELGGDEPAEIVSESQIFIIPVMDGDDELLTVTTAPATKTGTPALTISIFNGMLKFLGVSTTTYTLDFTTAQVKDGTGAIVDATKYFPLNDPAVGPTKAYYEFEPIDGAIISENSLYTFTVVDGAGMPIYATGTAAYNDIIINGYTTLTSYTQLNNAAATINEKGMIQFVGPTDDYIAFQIVSAKLAAAEYTFSVTTSYVFAANEIVIDASKVVFSSVQGEVTGAYKPTKYTLYAYDEDGNVIAHASQAQSMKVDLDDVELFAVKVTDVATEGYFVKGVTYYSETISFLSPFTRIAGTLPVPALSSEDYVSVDLWYEGDIVDTYIAPLEADVGNYAVFVDVSSEFVAGVEFDSMTATYVRMGSVYAIVVVDPTAPANPVIVKPTTMYELVLIASPTILLHIDASEEAVDNVAYLTADEMFEIVVDTDMVTGRQVVEKYTFAGWFVNGVAVNSKEASISVELTQNSYASAKYTVETYEVVSPTPEPEPAPVVDNSIDPTVLVIGICAVIVALIAVAYAVISSRAKDKKE